MTSTPVYREQVKALKALGVECDWVDIEFTEPVVYLDDPQTLINLLENYRTALENIAKPDDLVEVSGGAWTKQALEYRQAIARAVLGKDL